MTSISSYRQCYKIYKVLFKSTFANKMVEIEGGYQNGVDKAIWELTQTANGCLSSIQMRTFHIARGQPLHGSVFTHAYDLSRTRAASTMKSQ